MESGLPHELLSAVPWVIDLAAAMFLLVCAAVLMGRADPSLGRFPVLAMAGFSLSLLVTLAGGLVFRLTFDVDVQLLELFNLFTRVLHLLSPVLVLVGLLTVRPREAA